MLKSPLRKSPKPLASRVRMFGSGLLFLLLIVGGGFSTNVPPVLAQVTTPIPTPSTATTATAYYYMALEVTVRVAATAPQTVRTSAETAALSGWHIELQVDNHAVAQVKLPTTTPTSANGAGGGDNNSALPKAYALYRVVAAIPLPSGGTTNLYGRLVLLDQENAVLGEQELNWPITPNQSTFSGSFVFTTGATAELATSGVKSVSGLAEWATPLLAQLPPQAGTTQLASITQTAPLTASPATTGPITPTASPSVRSSATSAGGNFPGSGSRVIVIPDPPNPWLLGGLSLFFFVSGFLVLLHGFQVGLFSFGGGKVRVANKTKALAQASTPTPPQTRAEPKAQATQEKPSKRQNRPHPAPVQGESITTTLASTEVESAGASPALTPNPSFQLDEPQALVSTPPQLLAEAGQYTNAFVPKPKRRGGSSFLEVGATPAHQFTSGAGAADGGGPLAAKVVNAPGGGSIGAADDDYAMEDDEDEAYEQEEITTD